MNRRSGITLIALIITIIILLILAGITISTLSGENGLFTRAKQARQNTIDAQDLENEMLTEYENIINSIIDGKGNDDDIVNDPITVANYGEYVDLETTILSRTPEGVIEQKLGGENPTEQPLTDWRIFHKDADGGIYLILADYLSYSHEEEIESGLNGNDTEQYLWSYNYHTRQEFIDVLNNTSVWNKLLASKYIDEGLTVTGALTVEKWVESWNAKAGKEELVISYSEVSDESGGYDVYSDNDGNINNNNTLYFSHSNSEFARWLLVSFAFEFRHMAI